MRSRVAFALTATMAGCFDPSLTEGLPCTDAGRCPGELACIEGLCLTPVDASPCAAAAPSDPFAAGAPCATWGTSNMTGSTLTVSGGVLEIVPEANQVTSAGCTSFADDVVYTDAGNFIEVLDVPVGPGAYVFLQLYGPGPGDDAAIGIVDDMLRLVREDGSLVEEIPYDPETMRWLRLRPERVAGATIGEYSSDATHWQRLGVLPDAFRETYLLDLSAGTPTAEAANPGIARFDNLNVCP